MPVLLIQEPYYKGQGLESAKGMRRTIGKKFISRAPFLIILPGVKTETLSSLGGTGSVLPPLAKVAGDEKLDIKEKGCEEQGGQEKRQNSGETEDPKVSLGSFLWVSIRPDIKN